MSDTRSAGAEKPVELSPIHDFASKLTQPGLLERLKEYVRWAAELRKAERAGKTLDDLLEGPDRAPISVNLDLTTSCNFACDHCIDMGILNTGARFDHDRLIESLGCLAKRGLRSVILIGGGEPTLYPKFAEVVHFLKDRKVQVSIVTNGSRNDRILEVADRFDRDDWVRMSLDAGSDETFQAMHKPRKAVTLDRICEGVPPIKEKNPVFPVGFSFVVVWNDARINDANIVENVGEIATAAERARRYRFDYIAIKPFLVRAEANNAEIVDLGDGRGDYDDVVARIRAQVAEAKKLETGDFTVYETTNLKVLENRTYKNYTRQPKMCHMQFFRQVISPLGLYNCPAYRNQPHGRMGPADGYADEESTRRTRRSLVELIRTFDVSVQCREVTCLYNHVNWFLEDLIEHPEKLDALTPSEDRRDVFL
jgi:molybdenum cofactor biosynthesis enzyme MoaA